MTALELSQPVSPCSQKHEVMESLPKPHSGQVEELKSISSTA